MMLIKQKSQTQEIKNQNKKKEQLADKFDLIKFKNFYLKVLKNNQNLDKQDQMEDLQVELINLYRKHFLHGLNKDKVKKQREKNVNNKIQFDFKLFKMIENMLKLNALIRLQIIVFSQHLIQSERHLVKIERITSFNNKKIVTIQLAYFCYFFNILANLSKQIYLNTFNNYSKMEFQLQKINKDEEDLNKLNLIMKNRAQKFGSVYEPMTLGQYKLYKIKRASQTGNIAFLQNILLSDIEDMKLRKKAIQERTQKFFPQIQVKSEGNFNQKQQPDLSAQDLAIRQNAWYLFGVDYMSNQRIRNYFHEHPHFQIQWLNDSACNIVFNSVQQAIEAIKPHRKGDSMTDENQQIWYELQDYDVQGVKRKLVCRLATNRDIKKNQIKGQNSQYYKWLHNKKKFNNYVKKRAGEQMRKTKGIHHPHQKLKVQKINKKQQEDDSDSSSGVDSQSPMKNE